MTTHNTRTLIVMPKYVKAGRHYELPAGLGYIVSALKNSGYMVDCLNLNNEDTPIQDQIREKLKKVPYDIVATGGLSPEYNQVNEVLSFVKKENNRILTIAGGGLVSSEPELMVENLNADIGVIGEGEETICDIVNAIEAGSGFDGIKGVVFKSNGRIVKGEERSPIKNIDILPFPDYCDFDLQKFFDKQRAGDCYYYYANDEPRLMPIIASRSCPFNCTFCYHPLGKLYRSRSVDNIMLEVESVIEKYDVNIIVFTDELLAQKKERLVEFCEKIRQFGIKWHAQTRADCVDRDTLRMMKESGMFLVGIGIENASEVILKSMKKHVSIQQIETALSLARSEGIGVTGNILFGDPAETWQTAMQTLNWWRDNYRYSRITMNVIRPLPYSEDYKYCLDRGIIKDKLEYHKSDCLPLNMSDIPMKNFYKFTRMVADATRRYAVIGRVLTVKSDGFDSIKNDELFTIEIECPSCGVQGVFKHYFLFLWGFLNSGVVLRFACRACHQSFWINLSEMIEQSKNIETRNSLARKEREQYEIFKNHVVMGGLDLSSFRIWWVYALKFRKPLALLEVFLRHFKNLRKRRKKRLDEKRIVHYWFNAIP